MAAPEAAEKKQYRASSAVALKTLSAWEQANLSPWYHPQFWLDLLIHPSKEFTMNHQRRRARLYALVSFIFLVVSVIANIIFAEDGRSEDFLATHAIVNILLAASYVISRTRYAQVGKTIGVFAVWLLPYVTYILNLKDAAITDVTVTDSVSWLFTPAWILMAAIFLSRSATVGVVMLDCFSLLLLPAFAGCSFFAIRKLLLFHIVCNSLLMMASIIAFRDKLQLYSQHDGQSHEDQHQAGTIARFLLQPHNDITDRIFRRRSRILSAFHLILIPSMLAWMIVEISRLGNDQTDGVVLGLSIVLLISSIFLYILSRTQYTRWASRLTLFMLLIAPYIYFQAPSTTMEGQLFANLITMTSAAILGVTLFSGAELVALAAIIFFPTVYSPLFPPHVILSLILLVSSFIYRRDIKEIHDTAFHRDDLYEDDTSDLLIPWEKKYFFGKLSYIQMVQAHYGLGFLLICVLGLAALVGVATSDAKVLELVKVSQVPTEDQADYVIYVTTNACTSTIPQIYTVTGANGYFEVRHADPLGDNTLTSIYVDTLGEIGAIVTISVKLGDGSYSLTQYDTCSIEQIEVWDPVEQRSYSTSVSQYQPVDEDAGTGRRLLGFNLDRRNKKKPQPKYDDCSNLDTVQIGGEMGQLVASFTEVSKCRFRIPGANSDKCVKFLQSVGISPLSWAANACQCRGIALQPERLLPCYELGCEANKPTCSGHGNCVILRQLSLDRDGRYRYRIRGGWRRQNLVAVCNCTEGFAGDRCEISQQQSCAGLADSCSEYNGTCTVLEEPNAGAINQLTPRLGNHSYSSTSFTTSPGNPVPPTTPAASLNDFTKQNLLAIGFVDFLLEDIIVPERLITTGSSAPQQNPFSSWCAIVPEYANLVTSWIDASPLYGVDETDRPFTAGTCAITPAVQATIAAKFSTRHLAFQKVLELLIKAHNLACSRITAINNPAFPTTITHETRFEAARYATGLWLQNIAIFHVLPSFFGANAVFNPNTFIDPTTAFIPDHYLNEADIGEVPLAAAADLLLTLRQVAVNSASFADCELIFGLPPFTEPLGEDLLRLILTKANPFGSALDAAGVSAYTAEYDVLKTYGLPSYQELKCNIGPTCPTNPPRAGTAGATDFYNTVHTDARFNPFTATELAFQNNLPELSSNYPPLAFWLTFGIIRKAYRTDPHRWDVARNGGLFNVWSVSSTNQITFNILEMITSNCNIGSPLVCSGPINSLRSMFSTSSALPDFVNRYVDVSSCSGSINFPLVAADKNGQNALGDCGLCNVFYP